MDGAGQVTRLGARAAARFAIDPVLGRLAFAADQTGNDVTVTYSSGFADELGSREYNRSATFTGTDPALLVPSASYTTIQSALDALGTTGTVVMPGSGTWTENLHVDLTGRTAAMRAIGRVRAGPAAYPGLRHHRRRPAHHQRPHRDRRGPERRQPREPADPAALHVGPGPGTRPRPQPRCAEHHRDAGRRAADQPDHRPAAVTRPGSRGRAGTRPAQRPRIRSSTRACLNRWPRRWRHWSRPISGPRRTSAGCRRRRRSA